ncbi:hypothetical protein MMC09_006219 [Bachmanniomyces sp. S44760]|nr:hypothetical protein [Bachmanniomyces sp. S44760]
MMLTTTLSSAASPSPAKRTEAQDTVVVCQTMDALVGSFTPEPKLDIQCCIKGSSPPPPPKGPSWPSCQQTLSCTFDLIQKSSISDRLAYVRYMESHFFSGQLKSGTQFRAIEGVITFFQSKGLGGAGTWVSYVDSGIVEAIQRGGAIALGMSSATGNNPGTEKWADFLHEMQTGSLGSRDAHDPVWSRSEQAATEYGKSRGDSEAQPASTQDLRWFQFTQLFRLIMRNRSVIIHSIQAFFIFTDPPLALAASPFINWLTDVTDIKPTLCGSAVAWDLSALDTPIGDGILTDAKILAEIIPKFYECYKNR